MRTARGAASDAAVAAGVSRQLARRARIAKGRAVGEARSTAGRPAYRRWSAGARARGGPRPSEVVRPDRDDRRDHRGDSAPAKDTRFARSRGARACGEALGRGARRPRRPRAAPRPAAPRQPGHAIANPSQPAAAASGRRRRRRSARWRGAEVDLALQAALPTDRKWVSKGFSTTGVLAQSIVDQIRPRDRRRQSHRRQGHRASERRRRHPRSAHVEASAGPRLRPPRPRRVTTRPREEAKSASA